MDIIEKQLNEAIAALPMGILPKIELPGVNQPVPIYKGKFEIHASQQIFKIEGEIYFTWKPEPGIVFSGTTNHVFQIFQLERIDKLLIEELKLEHGTIRLTHSQGDDRINGVISSPFVLLYKEELANNLYFEIPNFKNTSGETIKYDQSYATARMQWEHKDYSITIDKLQNFDNIYRTLKSEGGYALTHTGQIIPKSGSISHHDGKSISEKLGLFLSFIKGRRSYPCFLQGFKDDKLCWIDYSAFYVDHHRDVDSWLPQYDYSAIPELWKGFLEFTKNEDDFQCIDYLLHWYFEANNNSGFVEGSIVLLQNGFELLFNWQILGKNLYTVKRGNKIDADVKIRELLKQAKLPLQVPTDYQEMEKELKAQRIHFKDFPKLFTLIRNAIVHSDQNKRAQLSKFSGTNRFYIKQTGLYHMELLLLHLFGYKGKIANRLPHVRYAGGNEELVPWMNIS